MGPAGRGPSLPGFRGLAAKGMRPVAKHNLRSSDASRKGAVSRGSTGLKRIKASTLSDLWNPRGGEGGIRTLGRAL